MSTEENKIKNFLKGLGLSSEEAEIYLSLVRHGVSTTLEVSRMTNISRTQVYRLLEKMKEKGVIEEIIDENTTRVKAVEVDRIEHLLKQKESNVEQLKANFDEIKTLLSGSLGINQLGTKVLFYRGKSGLKQMIWNVLRAKNEIVGYTYQTLESYLGKKFADSWFNEAVKRKILMRDIISDTYLKSAKESFSISYFDEGYDKLNKIKYLPDSTIKLNHQVDIYNDVVAYYRWFKKDAYGVEIYNKELASMQKQMFEILWKLAKPANQILKDSIKKKK